MAETRSHGSPHTQRHEQRQMTERVRAAAPSLRPIQSTNGMVSSLARGSGVLSYPLT